MDTIESAQDKISQIESLLARLGRKLEQEKSDVENLGWPDVGSLGYIAEKLSEADEFWGNVE